MRLTHAAACAALVVLAACQDSPVMQGGREKPTDLSKVTILKPADYAAHGITDPTVHQNDGPRMVIDGPCYPDDPTSCGGGGTPPPPPRASLDYFTSNDHTNNGVTKTSLMWSYSQAHTNMESMVLRLSYQVVGAQDWKGCGATPAQFDSDYLVAFGSPQELRGSRYASYNSSAAFVWRIQGQHTFTANYGYTVDGTNRSRTFTSSNTTCW